MKKILLAVGILIIPVCSAASVQPQSLWNIYQHDSLYWHYAKVWDKLSYKDQRLYSRIYELENACITVIACDSVKDNFIEWAIFIRTPKFLINRRSDAGIMKMTSNLHKNFIDMKIE